MNPSVIPIGHRLAAGLLAGVLGGVALGLLLNPPPGLGWNVAIGAALGVIFGLVLGPRIPTFGAGLVWGEAYGLFWWLAGSLSLIPLLSGQGLNWTLDALQKAFPILLGQVVGYGTVLGLTYHFLARALARLMPAGSATPIDQPGRGVLTGQAILPPLVRKVLIGTVAGLLGCWVFMRGIEAPEFFPMVAGLVGSDSMGVGQALHYVIGALIGVSFSLLFCGEIQGVGSGLVWGVNYGLLWWVLGPLTLMPWLLGMEGRPDWSLGAGQAVFPALVAHMLYGALVGLFYSLANKLWQVLFVDSDPLNRPLEGAGTRGLRALLMGQAGGIIGGLLFTIATVGVGALPRVGSLVGTESAFAGFVVHLVIATIIGSSYGLLFQREAYSYGSALAWGLVYGLVWWLLGALTLFPILLRQSVDWSFVSVAALYPSLVGHLLYGAGLGLFFQLLARRYDAELCGKPQLGIRGTRHAHRHPKRRCAGTPASALWAVTLVLGILLPLLLATNN